MTQTIESTPAAAGLSTSAAAVRCADAAPTTRGASVTRVAGRRGEAATP
jgi:hypothetical protein